MKIKAFTLSTFSIVIALTVLLASSMGLADTEARGLIDQDTNWTLDKSPYIAIGRLVVKEGVTLIIEPGVTVKFKSNTALRVDGTLVARGTQEMPIIFTAFEEKEPGSWDSISFAATSTPTELDDAGNYIQGGILEYAVIEYAGGNKDIDAAVKVKSSNLLIDHCTISYSNLTGIFVDSGGSVIRNSTISDNKGRGISVSNGIVTISNNTIARNTCSNSSSYPHGYGGGIYVSNGTATITNNAIIGNTVSSSFDNYGGGIYVSGSTATIANNTIAENAALSGFDSYGGGIYVSYSTATITNNTITSNTANDGGGGVYVSGSIQDFNSNTILGNATRNTIFIGSVPDKFKDNCIYNNETDFDIYYDVKKGTDMDATENYWGTTDEGEISARICDGLFSENTGFVNFVPFLNFDPNSPSAPTELVLTIPDASSVQLTWKPPEPDVAGYKLYYDTDAGPPYEGKGVKEGDSPIDVKQATSYTLSGLQTNATYYFAVSAYYADGKESGFSNEVPSNSPPQAPSNVAPSDAAKDISLTTTLRCSSISDDDVGDAHKASQWQITTVAGDYTKPVYGSGADTVNKISVPVPEGVLSYGTTYWWCVRHQDNKGAWSDYSAKTSFTTIPPPGGDGKYRSSILLPKGISIISLPLKPDKKYTAKTLADDLGATIVIKSEDGRFIVYVPDVELGVDFPLEEGKGYIINLLTEKSFTLTGTPWGEPLAPPNAVAENTWALVVVGDVTQMLRINSTSASNLGRKQLLVNVTNLRTGMSSLAPVDGEGRFTAVFVDMNRNSVAKSGDELEIIITNGRRKFVKRRYITAAHIERAYIEISFPPQPGQSKLLQNFPNPFNPETWLPYQLVDDASVAINIYNVKGQLIRILNIGLKPAGFYLTKDKAACWDGRDNFGNKVASSVYFYTLQAGKFKATRRMVILK